MKRLLCLGPLVGAQGERLPAFHSQHTDLGENRTQLGRAWCAPHARVMKLCSHTWLQTCRLLMEEGRTVCHGPWLRAHLCPERPPPRF